MGNGGSSDETAELATMRQRVAELEAELGARDDQIRKLQGAHEQLRLLIERSPYCIHRIDFGRKLCSMNRAGLDMMNVEDEHEIVGMDYLAAVCDDDRPRIAQLLERAYLGESSKFEFKSVTDRHFKSFFIPLVVGGGQVQQLMGLTQDITELNQTMAELKRSEEFNRRIIEALPCGLCHVSASGEILAANAVAAEILGVDQGALESLAKPPFDTSMVFEDGAPCRPEDYPVRRALVTGEPQPPVMLGTMRADGHYTWAIHAAVPIKTPDTGQVAGAVVTFVDVTASKSAEQERRRFEDKLLQAQKLESLGVLAGGIAHDFNNLLVGVLGNAGLARLELGPGSPAAPILARIEDAARRGAELTKQLLDYAGKARRKVDPLDLSSLTADMADLLGVSVPKLVTLERTLPSGLPAIRADATQLRQVVMNLVINAAESIDGPGSVTMSTGSLEVGPAQRFVTYSGHELTPGSYVYLEVSDTGRGMDTGTIARIFDPFFSTKRTGRGLGLSTVLGTVRNHGGGLTIDSRVGEGTRFRVLFPAVEEEAEAAVARPPAVLKRPFEGTVLVVDDDPTVRLVAAKTLARMGFSVLEASDGVEGLEIFESRIDDIELVLLDQTMPRMGGPETLREIRRLRPGMKVILSSGHGREHTIRVFGADPRASFIEKPYGPRQLEAVVTDSLRRAERDTGC